MCWARLARNARSGAEKAAQPASFPERVGGRPDPLRFVGEAFDVSHVAGALADEARQPDGGEDGDRLGGVESAN